MRETDRWQLLALLTEIKPLVTQSDKNAQEDNPELITHAELTNFFGMPPNDLDAVTKKQVALAKRLAGAMREENEKESDPAAPLVPIMACLEKADRKQRDQFGYSPAVLDPKDRDFIIPTDTPTVDTTECGKGFAREFRKLGESYSPEVYQTVFALLHKYTARIQGFPHDPDVSLYDFLRTTAAIAVCIAQEGLSETDIDAQLGDDPPQQDLCMLLKGDISGIQSFLYQILSDGAARQLRGRSFYLQLLTEAIAHWVLKQLDLPIVNLLLASGGHFYILVPYTKANKKLKDLQRKISEKLWTLHQSDLSFILAGTPVMTGDFKSEKFSSKWGEASIEVNNKKEKKWSEMGHEAMFDKLFKPTRWLPEEKDDEQDDEQKDSWKFGELGGKLRDDNKYLLVFEGKEDTSDDQHTWKSTLKAFGWKIELMEKLPDFDKDPPNSSETKPAIIYRLGDADFSPRTWDNVSVSYDFRLLPQVIAHPHDDKEAIADYNYIANASDGVNWLGALRMDVDDLGLIFRDALGQNATLSRMATLSESLRFFFEGYVPKLCEDYNQNRQKGKGQILELIYAGGDDLFLVGGWSALPEIAKKIRDEFRCFVTGDHVTLSGGIFIEHQKFPLYQFADRSGEAEHAAKELKRDNSCQKKDAISFLQKPMSWEDFEKVSEWHQKFVKAVTTRDNPLPRDILTRLSQIYSDKELEDTRWAWRSLYYFYRMRDRYKKPNQLKFLETLERALNRTDASFKLKEFIRVVARWAALQTRQITKED